MTHKFWIGLCLVTLVSSAVATAEEPFRLMSAERDAEYRQLLPRVESDAVAELLADPRTILYTEREMPPAYQDWDGGLQGVHSVHYNISADRSEPHGNGNREFPWADAAGTGTARGVDTVRFLALPADGDGATLPIVWYRKHFRRDVSTGYGWRYPVGTVFGEAMLMRLPSGEQKCFELRLRIRETNQWAVDVFRPFPTAADLAAGIQALRPQWQDSDSLRPIVESLTTTPATLPVSHLANRHPRVVFSQSMGVDVLPSLDDEELLTELLAQPFASALGERWRTAEDGTHTFAPTAESSGTIVPQGYRGGFIAADRDSCMRCHETVNTHVRAFESNRDWYGRVRGSDGIFSFHPFDRGSISHNGFSVTPRMNSGLRAAGLLQRLSGERHRAPRYQRIRGLDL